MRVSDRAVSNAKSSNCQQHLVTTTSSIAQILFRTATLSARLMAELIEINAWRRYPTIGLAEETKHSCRAIHYGPLA